MAFLYLDEHSPEEQEYNSNYLFFDENAPGVLNFMMKKCAYHWKQNQVKDGGYEIINDDLHLNAHFSQ